MYYRKNERVVDLDAIRGNMRAIRAAVGNDLQVMAVVKADAYGHGILQVSRAALEAGASFLGVALPEEGETLRKGGIDAPVLILGPATREGAGACVRYELTQTVCSPDMVGFIQEECLRQGRDASVHLKVDTGMNRIGVRNERELRAVLEALEHSPQVRLTGAFTHFADADGNDSSFTEKQLADFQKMAVLLPRNILLHASNSAAIARFPKARFQMVRAGIALYGCPPVPTDIPLRPAMRWTTAISYLKEIGRGDTVSYGRTFTADKLMRVATLPVGYGDGYHRALSGTGKVLIRSCYAPILGRVCMDQTVVDVTDIPEAALGDEAVLIGSQGDKTITADQLGAWAGTISYEVLLAPTARVPRRFIHE